MSALQAGVDDPRADAQVSTHSIGALAANDHFREVSTTTDHGRELARDCDVGVAQCGSHTVGLLVAHGERDCILDDDGHHHNEGDDTGQRA